jgi:2-iminobutanoate/2-iminopropanoate deaminase
MKNVAFILVMFLLATGCAPAAAKKQVLSAAGAPAPIGAYSQGIVAGNTVYVAGQIAIDPATGQVMADASIEAQTRRVLENLRAVLAAGGMTLDDVVMAHVFVTDINEAQRMNAVYASYFGKAPPVRAVVEVSRLPRNVRVEIAAIAVK